MIYLLNKHNLLKNNKLQELSINLSMLNFINPLSNRAIYYFF